MLHFFRKHQKFFFLFVTLIIITTFVFFGTYQAFKPGLSGSDEVIFKAEDGRKIKKTYFTHLTQFLSDEGGMQGEGNYLNDGIICKEFFETGFINLLFKHHRESFRQELEAKHAREINYSPYVHPFVSFVSAESIWAIFAPDLKENLKLLQRTPKEKLDDIFATKVTLYLNEKKFPGSFLSQILRYQEKEYASMAPDARLMRENITLFGYKDLKDWFGEGLVEEVARVIINGASLAKAQGLKVTKEEAIAEIAYKNEQLFQAVKEELPPTISTSSALFRLYLRERGLDEETLVTIMQDVLLFRRLFKENSAIACIDTLGMKEFYSKANERVVIERYEIPEHLQFKTEKELDRFEYYLDGVSKNRENLLAIPKEIDSIAEIEARAPEVVGRRFILQIGEVSLKSLQAKVSVKESWEWEEKNEDLIKKEFPQFSITKISDLESLDAKGRNLIDEFARAKIVESHPEWIVSALQECVLEEKEILFKGKEKTSPLSGINDLSSFKEALEKEDALPSYTQDNQHFYNIKVKERKEKEILPFNAVVFEGELSSGKGKEVLSQLSKELNLEESDSLASYRLLPYLKTHPVDCLETPFSKQFNLVKNEEIISRGKKGSLTLDELVGLDENTFSDVIFGQKGKIFFYRIMDRKVETTLPLPKLLEAQKIMAREVNGEIFEKLVLLRS